MTAAEAADSLRITDFRVLVQRVHLLHLILSSKSRRIEEQ